MQRATIFVFLCTAAALAESDFNMPVAGIARDAHQQAYLMYGVAGNFVLRGMLAREALDWAFAKDGGLVSTGSDLLVIDSNGRLIRRRSALGNDPVLGPMRAQSPALCWLPIQNELWQIGERSDRKVPVQAESIGGSVLAVASLAGNQAEVAACRADRLWLLNIDLATGAVTRETAPGGLAGREACHSPARHALLPLDGKLLLAAPQTLLIQDAAGNERRLKLPGAPGTQPEIRRAGEHWVEIDVAGMPALLVRADSASPKLYRLPSAEASR
ncbi:MAG TPA: hypothetical protein VLX58_02390 [Bryobacteraceae bacterium]|nr:hypothetical protein [Bryobacteraceae bacterium]